jgi:hypothetical protein
MRTHQFLLSGLLAAVIYVPLCSAADVPPPAVQIASAVLSAPEEMRAGAAVLGRTPEGKIVTLRPGTNHLICLASDPAKATFESACYHKDLEPYMARGRELAAQKVTNRDRNDNRWKEIADGKLSFPKDPRTLYVLTGASYDAASGKVVNPYLRWVIYTPFATPETTGLSTKASDSAPWLMNAGTQGAHIMINPPKAK